jgi:predicted enzyme related to lactoylglutathione lyase
VQHLEVGLVGADDVLVDFYAAVFEMEKLPAIEAGPGVVHRLQGPGVVIKVMVPSKAPAPAPPPVEPFFAVAGLRYLTIYDDELDAVLERALARGGRVQHGPMEVGPGARIVVLEDPSGNVIEVVEVKPPPG